MSFVLVDCFAQWRLWWPSSDQAGRRTTLERKSANVFQPSMPHTGHVSPVHCNVSWMSQVEVLLNILLDKQQYYTLFVYDSDWWHELPEPKVLCTFIYNISNYSQTLTFVFLINILNINTTTTNF